MVGAGRPDGGAVAWNYCETPAAFTCSATSLDPLLPAFWALLILNWNCSSHIFLPTLFRKDTNIRHTQTDFLGAEGFFQFDYVDGFCLQNSYSQVLLRLWSFLSPTKPSESITIRKELDCLSSGHHSIVITKCACTQSIPLLTVSSYLFLVLVPHRDPSYSPTSS